MCTCCSACKGTYLRTLVCTLRCWAPRLRHKCARSYVVCMHTLLEPDATLPLVRGRQQPTAVTEVLLVHSSSCLPPAYCLAHTQSEEGKLKQLDNESGTQHQMILSSIYDTRVLSYYAHPKSKI